MSDAVEGKRGVRVHQTQEMKGKEGTGDPGGADAKSGGFSSGSVLSPSGEKGCFPDGCAISAIVFQPYWHLHCEMHTVLSIMISRAL